jgi:3-oxoacyl-[acyl-carrier-protein] synthase III
MYTTLITGVGHYVPERVITNEDLSRQINTTDEWITERTGIKERRFFTPGKDTVASMGAAAARVAMERAGVGPKDVDLIVFATITPDYYFPGSGVLMQRELGMEGIGAIDIRNQCTGFIYGISIGDQYIKTGMYKTVLVIGAEIQSTAMDMSDEGRAIAVIFGDGAGAVILQASTEEGRGILSTHLHADGRYAEELIIKDPGSSRPGRANKDLADPKDTFPYMNGTTVFKHAIVNLADTVMEALAANKLSKHDLDLLVPHQANYRITSYLQEKLEMPKEKVVSNIHKYGNTTAASVPIALSEAWEEGRVKKGDLVCLAAFGSGFTWGSALVRW